MFEGLRCDGGIGWLLCQTCLADDGGDALLQNTSTCGELMANFWAVGLGRGELPLKDGTADDVCFSITATTT